MTLNPLVKTAIIIFIVFFGLASLYYAKAFLVPVAFASILAMLLIPVSRWMESKGMNRVISSLLSLLILVLFFAGLIGLLSWQLSDLAQNLSGIEQKFQKFISEIQNYISNTFGIEQKKQEEIIKKQSESGGSSAGMIASITSSIMGVLVDLILVMVYIFLFLFFRNHIKKFFLKLTPNTQKENVKEITFEASKVSQKYLTGLALMIMTLWVLYGIGFSIIGVKYAIFFAILCGVLEIVPFVGNITGTVLTVVMSLVQGGDFDLIVGILITYALVQFIQTYILEPLIVGQEVNINPLFTIMGIVAGEIIWGIPGMILAIPIIGIIKIVCDHFEPLKPYGFLLGEEKTKKSSGFTEKIKKFFKK